MGSRAAGRSRAAVLPFRVGAAPPPPAGIRIDPGDNWQAKIDANPAGTTFVVGSGTHREVTATPKNNDSFIGESTSVIVSGARVLSGFSFDGTRWYIGGQTQQGLYLQNVIDINGLRPGYEADHYPEEVFVNGTTRLQRVASYGALGAGKWFFDYAADRIYLADNPAGFSSIETSVNRYFLAGPNVSGVLLENLIVEKYASLASGGAIGGDPWFGTGGWYTRNWTIRHCTARYNHGGGIAVNAGMTIENCLVSYNGQIGIRGWGNEHTDVGGQPLNQVIGYQSLVTIRDTKIEENMQLGYDPYWEGGASKVLASTAGCHWINCWFYRNQGFSGPWYDFGNYDRRVTSCLMEHGGGGGIFDEVNPAITPQSGTTPAAANQGIHKWNIIRNNGIGSVIFRKGEGTPPGDLGAGIDISNSSNAEVFENLLIDNKHGILARDDNREAGLRDYNGHHNNIATLSTSEWFHYIRPWATKDITHQANFNHYYSTSVPAGNRWTRGSGLIPFSSWQTAASGQNAYDVSGTLHAGVPTFDFAGATQFATSTYGPV